MILNKQIKNGNTKLCGTNGPSWPFTAIVFCRTRIRLRNPSIAFLLIYSTPCSFIKVQDTKFTLCVLRDLLINRNFKNVF